MGTVRRQGCRRQEPPPGTQPGPQATVFKNHQLLKVTQNKKNPNQRNTGLAAVPMGHEIHTFSSERRLLLLQPRVHGVSALSL